MQNASQFAMENKNVAYQHTRIYYCEHEPELSLKITRVNYMQWQIQAVNNLKIHIYAENHR